TSAIPPPNLRHSSAIPPDGLLYWKQALAVVYAAPSGGRCTGGHAGGETLGHAHLALSARRPGAAGVRGGRGYGGPLPGAVCGLARLDAHGARLARPPVKNQEVETMSSALLGARLLLSAVFLVAALAKHVH